MSEMPTKERVLRALLAAQGEISGNALARSLGLSRSGVWKAIEQLRQDGYAIDAATKRGYRLMEEGNVLSRATLEKHMLPGEIGTGMEIHGELASTNDRAKALALQGAAHGTIVLANRQSAGRGRFGRVFHSPEGSGVYFSCVLRPGIPAERAVLVTAMAAVAVARTMESLADVKAGIKWVNDVYIGDRKACGILCEAGMDFESGQLDYVVMGIGVNVGFMEFPEELREIATSLSNACGRAVSRPRFIAELVNQLNLLYPQLDAGGFMEEYRARSNVIGREVEVFRGSERYPARAIAISDGGSLIVRRTDGSEQQLHSGEISLKLR